MKNQGKITVKSLYLQGYKPCQAARILGRNPQHVCAVLRGARQSRKLHVLLALLPERDCPGKETAVTLAQAKAGYKKNLAAAGMERSEA